MNSEELRLKKETGIGHDIRPKAKVEPSLRTKKKELFYQLFDVQKWVGRSNFFPTTLPCIIYRPSHQDMTENIAF